MLQTGTFSGNPVSSAAALASIRELQREGVYEALFARGRSLMIGLQRALDECRIAGLPTNLPLLKHIAASELFSKPTLHTGFLDALGAPEDDQEDEPGVAIACLYLLLEQAASARRGGGETSDPHSPWHTLPGWRLNAPGEDVIVIDIGDREYRVLARYAADGFTLSLPSGAVPVRGRLLDNGRLTATVSDRQLHADVVRDGNHLDVFYAGRHQRMRCQDRDQPGAHEDNASGRLVAPMPGRVISVLVDRDAEVEKGQALMVIEAMKMEHTINAPADGIVTALSFAEGDLVDEGVELLVIEASESN